MFCYARWTLNVTFKPSHLLLTINAHIEVYYCKCHRAYYFSMFTLCFHTYSDTVSHLYHFFLIIYYPCLSQTVVNSSTESFHTKLFSTHQTLELYFVLIWFWLIYCSLRLYPKCNNILHI